MSHNGSITITGSDRVCQASMPTGLLRIEYQSSVDGVDDWAFALPPQNGDTWIVNLHGHGSHGDQLFTREDIKRDWLPLFQGYNFGILTPNLRDNAWMFPPAVSDLHHLLHHVRQAYQVQQFIFVGGSMGGTGNLIYATQYPDDVAAVVAMCPASDLAAKYEHARSSPDPHKIANAIEEHYGGNPTQQPGNYERHCVQRHRKILTMPIYIAHGDDDQSIPVSHSRQLLDGWEHPMLKYSEIPGGHHDSPLAKIYIEEGLKWVLKCLANRQPMIHSKERNA